MIAMIVVTRNTSNESRAFDPTSLYFHRLCETQIHLVLTRLARENGVYSFFLKMRRGIASTSNVSFIKRSVKGRTALFTKGDDFFPFLWREKKAEKRRLKNGSERKKKVGDVAEMAERGGEELMRLYVGSVVPVAFRSKSCQWTWKLHFTESHLRPVFVTWQLTEYLQQT